MSAEITKLFKNEIIDSFELTKSEEGDLFDAYLKNTPVFIRFERDEFMNVTALGDFFECSQIKKNFYLILGLWTDQNLLENETFKLTKIHVLKIKAEEWRELFPEHLMKLFKEVQEKGISMEKENYKEFMFLARDRWTQESSNLVEPKFLRLKKKIQITCVIRKKAFFDYFLKKYEYKVKMKK